MPGNSNPIEEGQTGARIVLSKLDILCAWSSPDVLPHMRPVSGTRDAIASGVTVTARRQTQRFVKRQVTHSWRLSPTAAYAQKRTAETKLRKPISIIPVARISTKNRQIPRNPDQNSHSSTTRQEPEEICRESIPKSATMRE